MHFHITFCPCVADFMLSDTLDLSFGRIQLMRLQNRGNRKEKHPVVSLVDVQ